MKRTISVLLLAAVMMTISCGETQTDAKDTTTSGDSTNTSAPETETYLSGLDFDGRKITLFCFFIQFCYLKTTFTKWISFLRCFFFLNSLI